MADVAANLLGLGVNRCFSQGQGGLNFFFFKHIWSLYLLLWPFPKVIAYLKIRNILVWYADKSTGNVWEGRHFFTPTCMRSLESLNNKTSRLKIHAAKFFHRVIGFQTRSFLFEGLSKFVFELQLLFTHSSVQCLNKIKPINLDIN